MSDISPLSVPVIAIAGGNMNVNTPNTIDIIVVIVIKSAVYTKNCPRYNNLFSDGGKSLMNASKLVIFTTIILKVKKSISEFQVDIIIIVVDT